MSRRRVILGKGSSSLFAHDELLKKHGQTEEEFKSTGLEWATLEAIFAHHQEASEQLQDEAIALSRKLEKIEGVHSVKWRIKSPEGLVAKIIRKKLDRQRNPELPELCFSIDSYQTLITDLIGLRALHLFKDEWVSIDAAIHKRWDLYEQPIAYIRKGDPEEQIKIFECAKCNVQEHPRLYRSVHYLLKDQDGKNPYIAEVQVRTIFEEGWSEIDHSLRYPSCLNDEYLNLFFSIFNRVAGSADEMGSFVKDLSKLRAKQTAQLAERDRKIIDTVSKLNISEAEKANLRNQVQALSAVTNFAMPLPFYVSPGIGSLAAYVQVLDKQFCYRCGKPFNPSIYASAASIFLHSDKALCPDCNRDPLVVPAGTRIQL